MLVGGSPIDTTANKMHVMACEAHECFWYAAAGMPSFGGRSATGTPRSFALLPPLEVPLSLVRAHALVAAATLAAVAACGPVSRVSMRGG